MNVWMLCANVKHALQKETHTRIEKQQKRLLRDHHQVTIENENAMKGNEIEESEEVDLGVDGDFDVEDLEKEVNALNLISDLKNENDIFRDFIKHFNDGNVKEYLVAISQDKHISDVRMKNLSKIDVDLQIKLTKLHSELSPTQRLQLAEINQLLIDSFQERSSNEAIYAFTNIPTTIKDMQIICLRSKYSIWQNMPKPNTIYESNLGIILPSDAVKNALLLGLDVALTRSTNCIEDVQHCINDTMSDGLEMRNEIIKLAKICNLTGKTTCITPYREFRDGFLPYTSLTANEGLLLHTLTLQSRDSTYDSATYTYPVALGHKSKDSMVAETAYINDINNKEDPTRPFKVYSKKHKSFINCVLCHQYFSMDQIEKRAHTLFAAGNSKFGATFAWSCCYDDIAKRLVSCKTCNNKSLKGEDSNTCSKCWNWDIKRAKYSKELVLSVGGFVKKPFKLTIKMQKEKSEEIFRNIVDGKASVTMAKAQFKTMCLPGDAIKLIVDAGITLHAIKTNTLDMHDLSGFHHLIDRQNAHGLRFPDFAMCRRINLTYEKLSCSPMHLLDLGKTNIFFRH